MCDIVKCIKMEAAERHQNGSIWARTRVYEFSLALQREQLCLETKEGPALTEELAISSKIRKKAEYLRNFTSFLKRNIVVKHQSTQTSNTGTESDE